MTAPSRLIAEDIESYLDAHQYKTLLRFITCGSVDDGKSTLIGRLLYESHLVFEDHPPDAEERHQVTVPAGLRQHALPGVEQDDGDIGGRGAGHHVARVLLVTGRIGNDELAAIG